MISDQVRERIRRLVGTDGSYTDREIDRVAMAGDASHYRLTPRAVVAPSEAAQVAGILRVSGESGTAVTFRSGGTSLSGQAVSNGVMLDVRRHFRRIEVMDEGRRVRVQPGATLRAVNARLAGYGRKLGPDPASEVACTVGGIIANNSSGMACGTDANAYRTLESLTVVLADGTTLDTGRADADDTLRRLAPGVHRGLGDIRDRVRRSPEAVATVRRLFAMKNTMGYAVNALLDHERPVDILARLMVGSEGTLGFVAEATFRTVPAPPSALTALLVFPDLRDAAASLPELLRSRPATVELMDARALRVAQRGVVPDDLRDLGVVRHAGLLVEYRHDSDAASAAAEPAIARMLETLPLSSPARLTPDSGHRAALWRMRKGLYAAVAGARPPGTSPLLEDIAVPVPDLARGCDALDELFRTHRYEESVVFGHAKDGNLHFMINERFDDPAGLHRYAAFTEDMVDLVLGLGGTLKAEHGTGRIMAPFVRRQYGDELYDVMGEIKALLDPRKILNPGVLLSDTDDSYLADLKVTPAVEPEVDRCVECGYCEPVCPSRDLTLTPRQRIVVRREIQAAEERGDTDRARRLGSDYRYAAVETCAAEGMCATACPLDINTGDLVRRLRAEGAPAAARAGWRTAARHWAGASRLAGAGLTAAAHLPGVTTAVTRGARRLLGGEQVPLYDRRLPGGGDARRAAPVESADIVFFPSCTGAVFGPDRPTEGSGDTTSAGRSFQALAARAGIEVRIPGAIAGLCCGTPWKSKGLEEGYAIMAARVLPALWDASDGGALPVVCDASSCTEGLTIMQEAVAGDSPYRGLRILDSVDYAHDILLDRLPLRRRIASIAIHPTCSSHRSQQARPSAAHIGAGALAAIARHLSPDVVVPLDWGCCAFAGDRGLLHPELTAAATAPEAVEVTSRDFAAYASSNRTCELGMTRATGRPYRHILELLDEATRPDPQDGEGPYLDRPPVRP
ncbi:FAD-binding and (Fe-S)-binding domain-containing protein [Streptomyces sp. NPDC055078]